MLHPLKDEIQKNKDEQDDDNIISIQRMPLTPGSLPLRRLATLVLPAYFGQRLHLFGCQVILPAFLCLPFHAALLNKKPAVGNPQIATQRASQ
jgi:hypothetical protein